MPDTTRFERKVSRAIVMSPIFLCYGTISINIIFIFSQNVSLETKHSRQKAGIPSTTVLTFNLVSLKPAVRLLKRQISLMLNSQA